MAAKVGRLQRLDRRTQNAEHEVRRLTDVISKARDLIGNQSGDITGAALDAWALLENPVRGSQSIRTAHL